MRKINQKKYAVHRGMKNTSVVVSLAFWVLILAGAAAVFTLTGCSGTTSSYKYQTPPVGYETKAFSVENRLRDHMNLSSPERPVATQPQPTPIQVKPESCDHIRMDYNNPESTFAKVVCLFEKMEGKTPGVPMFDGRYGIAIW